MGSMHWRISDRADEIARLIADRHYNRQKIGTPQFVPPGRCLVLLTDTNDALWVTSWPEYARHSWQGAWMCTCFRNEGSFLSSMLITEAVAATRWFFSGPRPKLGMITFVDPTKVKEKSNYGQCFRAAGFVKANPSTTQGGLIALQMWPYMMPKKRRPHPKLPPLLAHCSYEALV